ncbi:DNA-binding response regulator [Echinicola pacifica]|uniref:DNA-binding response regulator n=1 Tax=Echinicola pacifica TaxID=346377 RepID=A0A918PVX7_9BACT|nr:LytTR family DNA-binding domain-containing protein [Echinicola pacifica]GGZ22785.1 DNA-binding response regulator [Echinicola pacifica]
MKVGIIDDEKHCIESLQLELAGLEEPVEVIFCSSKVDEGLQKISEEPIDLLFLDVEMPRVNGFEFLDLLDKIDFEVVFTTAYSQYAVKAFKYHAFDYLLKPVAKAELKDLVTKYQGSHIAKSSAEQPELLRFISSLKKDNIIKSKIAVPVSEGLEFIKVDDILYAQSQNNYTMLHLSDGSTLLFSKTLKEAEKTLKKYFFMRIHQSYLINPNYMRKYFRHDGGSVMMENGQTLPISQRKKEELLTLFEAIVKNKSI